jgi:hypothetical protein
LKVGGSELLAAQRLNLIRWRHDPPREERRCPEEGPRGFFSGEWR